MKWSARRGGSSSPRSRPTQRGCRPSAASRTRPGGKLCMAGRSLDRITRVAKATGYLQDFPETISFDEAMRLPRREVLIMATGGQGEQRAALGRVAFGNHDLKLTEGDTVIFSSKIIPGNEAAIGRVMNALSDLGVIIVTDRQSSRPRVRPSGPPRARADVRLDPARDHRARARRAPAFGRAGPVCAVARRSRALRLQRNGDLIRLAPNGPEKLDGSSGRAARPRWGRHPAC